MPKGQNIVLGDINLSNVDWDSDTPPPEGAKSIFWFFTKEHSLKQIVSFPTYIRTNRILDLIFTTQEELIRDCRESEFRFSAKDHIGIEFHLVLSGGRLPEDTGTYLDYRNADYISLNLLLSEIDWGWIFHLCEDVEEMIHAFYDILYESIDMFVPRKAIKGIREIRYPPYIKEIASQKRKLWSTRDTP